MFNKKRIKDREDKHKEWLEKIEEFKMLKLNGNIDNKLDDVFDMLKVILIYQKCIARYVGLLD